MRGGCKADGLGVVCQPFEMNLTIQSGVYAIREVWCSTNRYPCRWDAGPPMGSPLRFSGLCECDLGL